MLLTLDRIFLKIRYIKQILSTSSSLEQKQKNLENLDFVTSHDLGFELNELELKFIKLIKLLIFPETVFSWKPKNISFILSGEDPNIPKRGVAEKHKYFYFHKFFKRLESKLGLDQACILIVFSFKSFISSTVLLDPDGVYYCTKFILA